MADIYLLLGIFLVFWYFIYLRKVAETARLQALRYCKQQGLQYISIARKSAKLSFSKRHGVFVKSDFEFEFSGDGESSAQGVIQLHGLKLHHVDLPAYRI